MGNVQDGAPPQQRPNRRPVHRTQWAAQFAVASELCKRGYEVAFTMGNHPRRDLMVISPKGASFSVDVKGLYRRNWWLVTPKALDPGLYYVLAFVPDDAPNRFFVLSQQQVNAEIAAGPDTFQGLAWAAALPHEGAWENVLPP